MARRRITFSRIFFGLKETSNTVKYVSFYEMADGALEKVMEIYPAHRVWLDACHAAGKVIAAGPLGDPPEGAMAIFPSREAAEEFIKGDPFVINGLVASWRIVEWRAAFL